MVKKSAHCSIFLMAAAWPVFWSPVPALCQGFAGTNDDGFSVDIRTPAAIARHIPHYTQAQSGECYWLGSTYGPSLDQDVCGEVVWAFDETPDSLACDPVPGDLTGKIALIRRGACAYGLKVYRAQQAGAIGVIIVNHFSGASDGACVTYNAGIRIEGMPGGDSAELVKIPSVFLQRETGTLLSEALKKGEKVEVCFRLPRVQNAAIAYHYATPLSQVRTLEHIYMEYTNRDTKVQNGIVAKVDISDPDGIVATLTASVASLAPRQTAHIWFPAFTPARKMGRFTAKFSNNQYTEPRDTLTRVFVHTPYTYATDNLKIVPGGAQLDDEISPLLADIEIASLYYTGSDGGEATYASFGIADPDSMPSLAIRPELDVVLVLLYDADLNDDGTNDLSRSFEDLIDHVVAMNAFPLTNAALLPDSILHLPLYDFSNPTVHGVSLKPRHPYYLSLYYDRETPGAFRWPVFSKTSNEFYVHDLATPVEGTPVLTNGWSDAEVVERLHLKGFSPGTTRAPAPVLSRSKVQISPNPAHETLRIQVRLESVSPTVRVVVFDLLGRVAHTATQHQLRKGIFDLDVRDWLPGTYVVAVFTEEGNILEKIVVGR